MGSEMCIRDRGGTDHVPVQRYDGVLPMPGRYEDLVIAGEDVAEAVN